MCWSHMMHLSVWWANYNWLSIGWIQIRPRMMIVWYSIGEMLVGGHRGFSEDKQAWLVLVEGWPRGGFMYNSSSSSPYRNVLFTSKCWRSQPLIAATARRQWMDTNFATGEKVSWKSTPSHWVKTFATKRALAYSMVPSTLNLYL